MLRWVGEEETPPPQAQPQYQPAENPPPAGLPPAPGRGGRACLRDAGSGPLPPSHPPTYHSGQQGDEGMAEGVPQAGDVEHGPQAQQGVLGREQSGAGGVKAA